jgi:peptidoglycan/xylan/chitin deacetylase (PgdA/CDA1 family)
VCRRCPAPQAFARRALPALLAGLAGTAHATCEAEPAAALIDPEMRLALPAGAPRTVALTLDACSGSTDARVLDVLVALSIPATIFATGRWIGRNPAALDVLRAHHGLFSLQDHGARHVPAVLGTGRAYGLAVAGTIAAVQAEIIGGAEAITAAGFPRPGWFRGATALYSPGVIAVVDRMGFALAGYSLNGDEGASLGESATARRIAAARSGDVILAHVNHPERAAGAGVAAGIVALHRAGVVFVRLDQLPTTMTACRRREAALDPMFSGARPSGEPLPVNVNLP